ncbi:hypothetical protein GCM10010201_35810 [Pilimelia columellifera subsp. columellifera]|uniref:Tetratricopeptide repeat protein n=1 Tax=Pilimelia columellifera subsp. columellifera TaxID=706583 RepID=A0ABN3NT44_9ACTN
MSCAQGGLNNLGLTLRQVRRFEEAIAAHQQAAIIFREIGKLLDQASSRVCAGTLYARGLGI